MNPNHWYPRDPKKYLTDTLHLDAVAECAYNRIIDYYYATGRPVPNDDQKLAMIGKVQLADWARVRGEIMLLGFFEDGAVLRHKICDRTIAEQAELNEKKRNQTKAAREARLGNVTEEETTTVTEDVSEDVTAVQVQVQSQIQPKEKSHTRAESACGVPDVPEVVTKPLPKPKTAAQFTIDQRYEWLKGEIFAFYKRPQTHRIDAYEESLLAEVSRRPDCKEEWRTIQAYRNTLKPSDRRYFPQSAVRLVEKWQDVLDRARNYEKPRTEMSITDKELERITRQFSGGAM